MEWRKTTRNSINEIAVSSHFKSSLQQNEHKSAGNNLSISQNTLQAELVLLLLDAKIFLSYTWISRVWMKDCCSFNENFSLLGKKKMTTKVKKILTIKILPNKVKWNVKDNNKDETIVKMKNYRFVKTRLSIFEWQISPKNSNLNLD